MRALLAQALETGHWQGKAIGIRDMTVLAAALSRMPEEDATSQDIFNSSFIPEDGLEVFTRDGFKLADIRRLPGGEILTMYDAPEELQAQALAELGLALDPPDVRTEEVSAPPESDPPDSCLVFTEADLRPVEP